MRIDHLPFTLQGADINLSIFERQELISDDSNIYWRHHFKMRCMSAKTVIQILKVGTNECYNEVQYRNAADT